MTSKCTVAFKYKVVSNYKVASKYNVASKLNVVSNKKLTVVKWKGTISNIDKQFPILGGRYKNTYHEPTATVRGSVRFVAGVSVSVLVKFTVGGVTVVCLFGFLAVNG